jgi:hypothetical protein
MRPDQPASQETRIRIPRKDITRMSGPVGPGQLPEHMPPGPAGPVPAPPAKTAPHGPATGNPQLSHPIPTRTRAGPRPSSRSSKFKSTAQANSTPANRKGQTRTPASWNIPRNYGQSSFKFARDLRAATIWNNPLRTQAAINTNIPKPLKRTPNFATLRSLWSLHPFPTHVLLLLHLHATPLR